MKKLSQATAKPVCHLYLFDQYEQVSEELINRALLLLPEERRVRALKYRRKIDRDNCVITYLMLHYGLRECYGIKSFKMAYGQYGKPYLPDYPDVHFNISHCDAGCAVVVADFPVGVDIQDVRPFSWDVARQVCCERELKELEKSTEPDKLFTKMWAIKECCVEMKEGGVSAGVKDIDTAHLHFLKTSICTSEIIVMRQNYM